MQINIDGNEIWDKLTNGESLFFVKKHPEENKKDRYFFVRFGYINGVAVVINISNSLTLEKALMSDAGLDYSDFSEKSYDYIEKAIQGIVRVIKKKLNLGFEFISKERMIESLLNVTYTQYLNKNKQASRIVYMRDNEKLDSDNIVRITIFENTINIERTYADGYTFMQGVYENTKFINKTIDAYKSMDYIVVDEDLDHVVNNKEDQFSTTENVEIKNYLEFRKRIINTDLEPFIISNLGRLSSYVFTIHEGDLHKSENYDLSENEVLLITGNLIVEGVLNLLAYSSLLVLGNVEVNSLINNWNCPIYIKQNLHVKNTTYLGEYPGKIKIEKNSSTYDLITVAANKNPFGIACENIYSPFEEPRYFYEKYYIEKNGMSYFLFTELLTDLKEKKHFLDSDKFKIANKKREEIKKTEVDENGCKTSEKIPNSIAYFHDHYEKYAGFSVIPNGATLKILASKHSFDPDSDIAVRDNRCKSGVYLLPHDDKPRCLEPNKKPDNSFIIDALTLIRRYFDLSNYLAGYYDYIINLKSIEDVNQAYNFEKSSLQDDESLANYWLFHFALLTDPRFDEVKSITQNYTIEEEISFIQKTDWHEQDCVNFKQRQAVLILNTYMDTEHFFELQNAYHFASLEMKLVAVYWMANAMSKVEWIDFDNKFKRTDSATDAYLDAMNPRNSERSKSQAAQQTVQELIDNEQAYKKLNQVPKNVLLNIHQMLKDKALLKKCYMLYISKYSDDDAYSAIASAFEINENSSKLIEILNESIKEKKPVKQAFDLDSEQLHLFFLSCIDNLNSFNEELLMVDVLWSHSDDKVTLITKIIEKSKSYLNRSRFLQAQQDRMPFGDIPGNNLELIKSLINIKNTTGLDDKYFINYISCFYQLLSLLPVDDDMYQLLDEKLNSNINQDEQNIVIIVIGKLHFSKTHSYAMFDNVLSLYKNSRDHSEKYQISELYKQSKNPHLVPWLKTNLLLNWFYESPETIANQQAGLFYKIYDGFEERVNEIDPESFSCKKEAAKYSEQHAQYIDDLIWLIFHTEHDTPVLADAIGYRFRNEYESHQVIVEKLLQKIESDFVTHEGVQYSVSSS